MINTEFYITYEFAINGNEEAYPLSIPICECLKAIELYFNNPSKHKLCLIFPSKELVAHWISLMQTLELIKSDFELFNTEILKSYSKYQRGQKLILNNKAIVEWVTGNEYEIKFKTKGRNIKNRPWEDTQGDIITINTSRIVTLRPAPESKKVLSSRNTVYENLNGVNATPVDKLLSISTCNNFAFQKNSIVVVSKLSKLETIINEVSINNFKIKELLDINKIDDNGEVLGKSALLITNNLRNLALYVTEAKNISKIVIDGFSSIHESRIDFKDIDAKKIPTILITDLSELDNFEDIVNCGFDFYSFANDNLNIAEPNQNSPFFSLEKKIQRFGSFSVKKEIIVNNNLEVITNLLHSIEKDDSIKELIHIKILIIQLLNYVSRIAHPLNKNEEIALKDKLKIIENYFNENRFYLGSSLKKLEDSILLLKSVIEKFSISPSEKSKMFANLIQANNYDYIICSTEDDLSSLTNYLNYLQKTKSHKAKLITITELKSELLLAKSGKALLTGWIKSKNINRILSCFFFSELTFLFYQFENKYLTSLQKRNQNIYKGLKATIKISEIETENVESKKNLKEDLNNIESSNLIDENFDISAFELSLENTQYSKYVVKGNINESVKAKRVEFKNEKFIYLTDSHSLLVLENYYLNNKKALNLQKCKIESLQVNDIIVFLKTERDLLNKVVANQTTPSALKETSKWIELWKSLLKNHYNNINKDFVKLVSQLKEKGCERDQVTIRSWLFDELKIGPRKDDDLLAIALLTNSTDLYENIENVRSAIKQMTGWRMKASDFLIQQLKLKIKSSHTNIKVNKTIDFEDLGEVEILELSEINSISENIDIKNVNRLLEKTKL